jgi:16S rRNA processing protein RimM
MAGRKLTRNPVSGSPSSGEPEYLVVGQLRRPHGIHGEMVMEVHTDFPERLKPDSEVYLGEHHGRMIIAGARFHNEGLLIKFQEVNSPEEAGRYRNQLVYVKTADRPILPKDQYYHHELTGFNVIDEKGELIGSLTEIMQTGANDVYIVRRVDGKELLLPVISSVVLAVDKSSRQIRVRLIPGLLDELAE